MPNLAQRLGCGVMTLYGYIDNKEDLLDAIALRGLADLRLPRPLPNTADGILLAWGRALRQTLLEHPSMPLIFLSQAVIGPGIFRGIESLLGALEALREQPRGDGVARAHVGERVGASPRAGLHAVYAVLIYATGFVAWELPRTVRQSQAGYAAAWRREFASLPPEGFPITASIADELPQLAAVEQFEFGLQALVAGLTRAQAGVG